MIPPAESVVVPSRLIIFARYPQPGRAKTRLIPALGSERAAQLQLALTRRTLDVARQCCSGTRCDLEVRFTDAEHADMRRVFGPEIRYVLQSVGDLGERLWQAVSTAFAEGMRRVVVIGTDCPELQPSLLSEAFQSLDTADVVLGPAVDGGYYLIGLRSDRPGPAATASLFEGIDWSTEHVLRQTLAKATAARCLVRQLSLLPDVDYVEDLLACRRVPDSAVFADVLPQTVPTLISVIIPTLNEELHLATTLATLAGLSGIEVLIADGGSTDGTLEIARQFGVEVIPVRAGRGRQLNAGAALARGAVLLFLHADTKLPGNFQEQVWAILSGGAIAGAFRLNIDAPGWGLRLVEWGANFRSRFRQLPYGDQALFLRAEQFYRVRGFPVWPLMEDYEFCRRLKQMGRIVIASACIRTSARRWLKLGLCRTVLINQLCVAGLKFGISPERLARWYAAHRKATP